MKKLLSFVLVVVVFLGSFAIVNADVWVSGYTKSNGTYVQGHYRSSPNSSPYDNYSYPGNTNPYTGKTAGGNADTYLKNYSNSSSYTYPSSYSSIPTCPANSYSSGSSCKCNYGYSVSGNSCVSDNSLCQKQLGYNSSADSLNDTCKCDYGYIIGSSGQCTSASLVCSSKIGIMSRYNSATNKCECMVGYEFDGYSCKYKNNDYSYGDDTEYTTNTPSYPARDYSITCPVNSTLTNGQCFCNSGYKLNSTNSACEWIPASIPQYYCPIGHVCTPDPTRLQMGDCPSGYKCTLKDESPKVSTENQVKISRNLKLGDSGKDVTQLQGYLEEQGLLSIPTGMSRGYYGNLTKEAVKQFQIANKLPVTGEFSYDTKLKF